MKPYEIVLASQSPRRKKLLALTSLPFTALPVDTDERFDPDRSIEDNVTDIALRKACSVWQALREKQSRLVVIGADTVVALEGEALGKPADYDEAFRMLASLRNRSHQVHTGFALRHPSGSYSECVTTTVTLEPISDSDIRHYLDLAAPFDKAGSYGIQDPLMARHVKNLEGCYYNVVGLPVSKVWMALKRCIPELFR